MSLRIGRGRIFAELLAWISLHSEIGSKSHIVPGIFMFLEG